MSILADIKTMFTKVVADPCCQVCGSKNGGLVYHFFYCYDCANKEERKINVRKREARIREYQEALMRFEREKGSWSRTAVMDDPCNDCGCYVCICKQPIEV